MVRKNLLRQTAGFFLLSFAVGIFVTGQSACAAADDENNQVLQRLKSNPGKLEDGSFYVPANLQTIKWGYLPNKKSSAFLTVPSGSEITFDCLSGEGMMEDQGRDPAKFFAAHGIPRALVLDDAVEIATSNLPHDFDNDGPHIIIGPVAIEGAQPGDVLKIDMISLKTRVPYGLICSEHGRGLLAGEYPENAGRQTGASSARPLLFNNVHTFVPIQNINGKQFGIVRTKGGDQVKFAINPFIGTLGVASDTDQPVNSVPPGPTGGNLDFKELTAGSTLYVPVQVPGAMFFVGDPHMAQGDGEVALTAVEGSLRARLKLTLLKAGDAAIPIKEGLSGPFAENSEYWMPLGLDKDLLEATKKSTRAAIAFLNEKMNMDRATALAYLSAATDFHIAEVVDQVKGVYAKIRKNDFAKGN